MTDGKTLELDPNSCDVAFSYITLQHCDPDDALELTAEAVRVTRPGGRIVLNYRSRAGMDWLLLPVGSCVRATFRVPKFGPWLSKHRFMARLGWQANRLDPDAVVGPAVAPTRRHPDLAQPEVEGECSRRRGPHVRRHQPAPLLGHRHRPLSLRPRLRSLIGMRASADPAESDRIGPVAPWPVAAARRSRHDSGGSHMIIHGVPKRSITLPKRAAKKVSSMSMCTSPPSASAAKTPLGLVGGVDAQADVRASDPSNRFVRWCVGTHQDCVADRE